MNNPLGVSPSKGSQGNIAETLLRRQMFPSLAAWEMYVAETNFPTRKPKVFLPEVKSIFASWTQMLRPKHMFPSLATTKRLALVHTAQKNGHPFIFFSKSEKGNY